MNDTQLRQIVEEHLQLRITDPGEITTTVLDREYAAGNLPENELELAHHDYMGRIERIMREETGS